MKRSGKSSGTKKSGTNIMPRTKSTTCGRGVIIVVIFERRQETYQQ